MYRRVDAVHRRAPVVQASSSSSNNNRRSILIVLLVCIAISITVYITGTQRSNKERARNSNVDVAEAPARPREADKYKHDIPLVEYVAQEYGPVLLHRDESIDKWNPSSAAAKATPRSITIIALSPLDSLVSKHWDKSPFNKCNADHPLVKRVLVSPHVPRELYTTTTAPQSADFAAATATKAVSKIQQLMRTLESEHVYTRTNLEWVNAMIKTVDTPYVLIMDAWSMCGPGTRLDEMVASLENPSHSTTRPSPLVQLNKPPTMFGIVGSGLFDVTTQILSYPCFTMDVRGTEMHHDINQLGYPFYEVHTKVCERTTDTFLARTEFLRGELGGFDPSTASFAFVDLALRAKQFYNTNHAEAIKFQKMTLVGANPASIMYSMKELDGAHMLRDDAGRRSFSSKHRVEVLFDSTNTLHPVTCLNYNNSSNNGQSPPVAPYCRFRATARLLQVIHDTWTNNGRDPMSQFAVSLHRDTALFYSALQRSALDAERAELVLVLVTSLDFENDAVQSRLKRMKEVLASVNVPLTRSGDITIPKYAVVPQPGCEVEEALERRQNSLVLHMKLTEEHSTTRSSIKWWSLADHDQQSEALLRITSSSAKALSNVPNADVVSVELYGRIFLAPVGIPSDAESRHSFAIRVVGQQAQPSQSSSPQHPLPTYLQPIHDIQSNKYEIL